MRLSEIRPCDACGGPIAPIFRVLEIKIAVINVQQTREVLGLAEYFHGSLALAEAMAPRPDPISILEEPDATVQLFICTKCDCRPICLAEIAERRHDQLERAREKEQAVPR